MEFVDRMEGDLLLVGVEIDQRLGIFEIVSLDDLFSGLIEGVVDFLEINLRDDVERALLSHDC
jgi:hypothetical protein